MGNRGSRRPRWRRAVLGIAGLLGLTLAGCGVTPERPSNPAAGGIADAVVGAEPDVAAPQGPACEVMGQVKPAMPSRPEYRQRGVASWYGRRFHGRMTAAGERYDMYQMTAAHPSLPLPSYVEVTNLDNGRQAVVRVNDRGPFHSGRIIDLSYAAAKRLDMVARGTSRVEVRTVPAQRPGPLEALGSADRLTAALARFGLDDHQVLID